MAAAEAKFLLYLLHEHVSICYELMEAVMYTPTADKAKMMIVGGNWDFDNAGFVSPYVLENMEKLKYGKEEKRTSIRVEDPQ